jgi:hypothetical protein
MDAMASVASVASVPELLGGLLFDCWICVSVLRALVAARDRPAEDARGRYALRD